MSPSSERKNTACLMAILKGLAIVSVVASVVLAVPYVMDLRANQALKKEVAFLRPEANPSALSQAQLNEGQPNNLIITPSDGPDDTVFPDSNMQTELDATVNRYTFASNDLLPLFRVNTDTVGWLNIADTRIDYPVVKGADNAFYLDHGFDKELNVTGAVFMDSRNIGDGSDRHTLIYGHRMKDGSMFRDLEKFQEEDFYQSNREIDLQTLHGTLRYRVFSAYVTGTDFLFNRTRFEDDAYEDFLIDIQARGLYPDEKDVVLTAQSRILTLSTCSRSFKDARFVVHAVLLEK